MIHLVRYLICFITIVHLPVTSVAQISLYDLEPVIGQNLEFLFSGNTMDGIYKRPLERSGTNEFTETFHTDGTTTYLEGPVTDKGQWFIKNNIICFDYSGPLAGNQSCFRVFRVGVCYYSYNPASIINGKPIDANRWSAKTVLKGDVLTCQNLTS